ncbi:MAG TPA: type II toxin-antitoxin system Phd/YefM family antitoxin [Bryobacteraceae bacterium]
MRASDVKPITYMKTHSAELVASVNKKRSPVVITQNGAPRAVVMDVQSYDKIQDAFILLKMISQSEEEFRKGDWLTQEQVDREVRARLGD